MSLKMKLQKLLLFLLGIADVVEQFKSDEEIRTPYDNDHGGCRK